MEVQIRKHQVSKLERLNHSEKYRESSHPYQLVRKVILSVDIFAGRIDKSCDS